MPLLSKGVARAQAVMQRKQEQGVMLLGVELRDMREELFVLMVCDGLAMGIAFRKAGFTSKDNAAPSKLFALPRIQQRCAAVLEARRKQAAISLPEVTDMLQRVFSKALHDDQMNAAHNAAFSLARLYGHVTDRAVVDVLRKPSRDPDEPAERSLTNWIDNLPARGSDAPAGSVGLPDPLLEAAPSRPRAAIEQNPEQNRDTNPEPNATPNRDTTIGTNANSSMISTPSLPLVRELHDGTVADRQRQSGNEAPLSRVTGTPSRRGQSTPLAAVSRETTPGGAIRKRAQKGNKVPVPAQLTSAGEARRSPSGAQKRKLKRMKELFG